MIDPESRRAGIEKLAKYGFFGLVAAVSAPIAYLAVQGLIMWLVFGAVVTIVAQFAPVFGTWVANKKIQALVAVIEANPIETMQNLYADKTEELRKAEDAITDFDAELGSFKDQVSQIRKDYPEEAQSYLDIQDRMTTCLKSMREEHTFATQQLDEFAKKIKKAQALFNMAKAANKMLERSQSAQSEVFAQIKEQVSFNKVRSDLNRAFANMDTAIERRKNINSVSPQAALPEAAPEVKVYDLGNVKTLARK